MYNIIEYNDNLIYSNNFICDSILNLKLQNLDDISTKISVFVPEKLRISDFDLTIILGNILDNAINGILDSERKELDVCIEYVKCDLIIIIKNSYNGKMNIFNGKIKTTKISNFNHGYGLNSVETIVLKYKGEIKIEYNEKFFLITIIIPNM